MIQWAIRQVVLGRNLSSGEAAQALGAVMEGEATPAQIAALLVGLRMKGETVEEIVGCAQAMRERALAVRCEDPDALDTCGTGGDGAGSFNVSTAAALVVAAAGVTVAKHGSHGVSSRCGSADLLRAAGLDIEAPLDRVERSLREVRLAFLYAPLYHPALRHALAPRREIGLRTLFNALGPLANPARVRRQVLGVYDRALASPLAHALRDLGAEAAWVVHGADGLDELSPAGDTFVAELRDGRVLERTVRPEQAGLRPAPLEAIRGGDPEENLRLLRHVLSGEEGGPLRDVVVLNAAAALVVAGRAEDLAEGAGIAARALSEGSPSALLARAVDVSRGTFGQ